MAVDLYIYLGSYILFLLAISFFISKKQTDEDFLISGRNRGGWQILASKFAGAIGAGYFITYTGFAYEYGLGVFTMLIGIIAGYFIFAYWAAPKVHNRSKEEKFYTMGDFVFSKTKSAATKSLTNIISNLILFFWLLVGIIGGAKIISDFGLLSYQMAVLLTVLVVLAYILMAGFKAVIITDVIQSIIIVGLMILITWSIIGSGSVTQLFSAPTGQINIGVAAGFFLFGLLAIFSYSNMYQLCYAAKTKRKLKHGMGLSVIPIIFVAFLLLLIGLFMATNSPGIDSGLVFTEALKNFLPLSLLPLGVVLFFAGIMSSADTNIYAISSHHSIPKHGGSLWKIRKASIGLIIITTTIALIFSDIVDISILAGGVSLTLSFAMLYLFFGGRKSKKFASSIILSFVGLLIGLAIFGINPTVAITTILGGVIGLFWIQKEPKILKDVETHTELPV